MLKEFESDMAIGRRKLGIPTRKSAESKDTGKQTAGYVILTLLLQVKESDLYDIAWIIVRWYTWFNCKN